MGEVIKVGMADLKTAKAPNTLTTLGLEPPTKSIVTPETP